MDRLKKEWRETEIPEELRLQARNLAWVKINRSTGRGRVLHWSLASITTVVVIVALWMGFRSQPRIEHIEHVKYTEQVEQVAPPTPESVPEFIPEPSPKNVPLTSVAPVYQQQSDVVDKPVAPLVQASVSTQEKERERIVLNFNLPESGARLIWIID